MATAIKTCLNYAVDEKTRQYLYVYDRSDEERKATPHQPSNHSPRSPVEVTINDARSEQMSLDTNGFELVQQTTALTTDEFYNNPELITGVYYKEIEEAIKRVTGASHVVVFNHILRNEGKEDVQYMGELATRKNMAVRGYGGFIHADGHPDFGDDLFREFAPEEYRKGRYAFISTWRNISDTPIGDNHLALCDELSSVKPDDYATCDIHTAPGVTYPTHVCPARYAHRHRWYYYSKMKKDELLVFKHYDSDPELSGRMVMHSAFKDPNAPSDTPPRESIEAKGIAFFPDHEPNTCPHMEEV